MRPTFNLEHIETSAIDLRDDILRTELPAIVGDDCHGGIGQADGVVHFVEEVDTRPLRRFATGTTPPSMGPIGRAIIAKPTEPLARGSSTMIRRGDE
jgi:hypothetical protein